MSSATWEEIKRLAADFQRVQLVESSYKLSERNCIEIISKLIDMGMLNVIHSIDGKEFITDKHLIKEIYDELYVHDGRINIVQLQTLLNVDISHIESKVGDIVKDDSNLNLILGQIISKDYMNKIAEEINELLQEKGSVSLAELTNTYELPTDFMQQIVKPRVGTLIKGNFDGKIFYTHNYVNMQKSLLAGLLEASIKPIRISQIIKEYNLEVGMIFDILDELIATGQIKGSLYGGRQEMSAVFVPTIYTKAQEQYVQSFFKQNGYIDYSSLKKIGLTEPDSYVKNLFKDQAIKYLSTSCFANYFLDSVEAEIEDSITRNGYCDLSQVLPSNVNQKDLNQLTLHFQNKIKATVDLLVMADSYLVSKSFLKDLSSKFQAKMEEKSSEDLKKPNYVLAFRTQHAIVGNLGEGGSDTSNKQASTSKSGKSAKGKKTSVQNESASDEIFIEIIYIDKSTLTKELQALINELPDDLLEPLIEYFLKPLNHQYFDLLKAKVESGLISSSKESSTTSETGKGQQSSKKLTIKDVQEKTKLLLINGKLFEKALKLFTDNKVQEVLSKHLIKTVYSEIANEMLKFLATESMISFNSEESFTTDSRLKIIQKLKEPNKQKFTELNQALSNKTSAEVYDLVEKVAVDAIELPLKKADPKREKEVLLQMRESTKSSLENEKEPATILHLTLTLLFYNSTGQILNAPGRCVPNILDFMKMAADGGGLMDESLQKLISFQNLIMESSAKLKTDESKTDTLLTLIDTAKIDEIKAMGLNAKAHLKSSKSTEQK